MSRRLRASLNRSLLSARAACALWLSCVGILYDARAQPASGAKPPASISAEDSAFFEARVRPVLVEHCFECHGPQADAEGKLHLTSRDEVLKGGETGPAAVVGDPAASLLVKAVGYGDALQMPPDGKLSDRDIAALSEWVARGLPWPDQSEPAAAKPANADDAAASGFHISDEQRKFWAFQSIANVQPPPVMRQTWPNSEIDRFILARLEQANLQPAPPADRRALLRRATYDLTGLPPTPEDVEAFVNDASPDAFAKVVDRLLASPQYGERWGRHWLDLVRYTDSFDARIADGANVMDCGAAWRYRDWVINAFNRDMPYDEFVKNQLAGDLLPPPPGEDRNVEGIIATGMLAIGNCGGGDSDKEKLLTDIADDQIDVVGRVFLGLTLACARCHDHKFDPIATADYYGLAGIFMSTHILEDPGPKTNGPPMLRVPLDTNKTRAARADYEAQIAATTAKLAAIRQREFTRLAKRQTPNTEKYLQAAWEYSHWTAGGQRPSIEDFARDRTLAIFALKGWVEAIEPRQGALLTKVVDNLLGNPGLRAWRLEPDTPSAVVNASDNEAAFLSIHMPPRSVAIHPSPSAGVAVEWRATKAGRYRIEGRVTDADTSCGNGIDWTATVRHGRAESQLASGSIDNGGRQDFAAAKDAARLGDIALAAGDSLQIAVLPRGEHSCDTTLIDWQVTDLDAPRHWSLAKDLASGSFGADSGNPHDDSYGNDAVWRFLDLAAASSTSPLTRDPVLRLWYEIAAQEANDAAAQAEAARTAAAVQQAVDRGSQGPAPAESDPAAGTYALLISRDSPFWGESRGGEALLPLDVQREIAQLESDLASLQKNPPTDPGFANACLEGGCPKSAQEGLHDVRIHIRGRYDRLGPVVPRHFPEILAGSPGEQPPINEGSGRLQLAQWLAQPDNRMTARVMVNRIWQQHFGEGIVRTPSNFGKLGEPPTHPELLDWLAANFIETGWSIKAMHRAIMLSAAYQQSSQASPDALERDADNRLFGRMNRRRLDAEQLRDSLLAAAGGLNLSLGGPPVRELQSPRRTIYLMTIRSDRATFRSLFDAADSTAIVDKRNVSTVAPQALFMLNNPFVQQQAQRLAQRALNASPDEAPRVESLYRWLFGRTATPEEQAIAHSLLEQWLRPRPDVPADQLDPRAWREYCQVLLCSNELVFVD
jgi:hypothetical protein